jgi:hypothetical protein
MPANSFARGPRKPLPTQQEVQERYLPMLEQFLGEEQRLRDEAAQQAAAEAAAADAAESAALAADMEDFVLEVFKLERNMPPPPNALAVAFDQDELYAGDGDGDGDGDSQHSYDSNDEDNPANDYGDDDEAESDEPGDGARRLDGRDCEEDDDLQGSSDSEES